MAFLNIIKANSRPLTMLVVMLAGVVLHRPLTFLDNLSGSLLAPTLIFSMLFVTFCSVKISDMSFTRMHCVLLVVQLVGAALIYYALLPFGHILAQGGMICLLAPIAMGAAVIGSLLGADVAKIAAYSLLCSLIIAIVAPVYLSLWGNGECTFGQILARVFPMLVAPLLAAQLLRFFYRPAAEYVASHSRVSFYLWLGSMALTLARVSSYIVDNSHEISLSLGVALAAVAAVACVAQFAFGRYLGSLIGDAVSYGQSLGQKNTVLAVWMAQQFLSPIAALAPTAYIIWQNLVNSLQIYLHDRRAN